MPISSLLTMLSVVAVLVGVRVLLFKVFKPSTDLPSLPVEVTTAQATGEETLPSASLLPVVVLLGVVVGLTVGLIVFGNALGG